MRHPHSPLETGKLWRLIGVICLNRYSEGDPTLGFVRFLELTPKLVRGTEERKHSFTGPSPTFFLSAIGGLGHTFCHVSSRLSLCPCPQAMGVYGALTKASVPGAQDSVSSRSSRDVQGTDASLDEEFDQVKLN